MASTKIRTKEQQELGSLEQLRREPIETLLADQEICAKGKATELKDKTEADGIAFPDVATYCRAVIDISAERNLEGAFYGNLYLQDKYGIAGAATESDYKELADGKASAQVIKAIVKASGGGETSYVGPAMNNVHPLPPSMAYDAGYFLGMSKPDKVPSLADAAEREAGSNRCFDVPFPQTIALNGVEQPATYSCLVLGGNAGKDYKLTGAMAPGTPVAPGATPVGSKGNPAAALPPAKPTTVASGR